MIRIEHIKKSFGDVQVLKGISHTFEAGKTNLIIGKSGAGKTVMLKILVGLFPPSSGSIFYDDTDFIGLDKKQLRDLRMKVGMLFQGSALFDSMTVEENVRFPLDMFTTQTKKEKDDRVNYCLDRVGLNNANKKYPSEISGGMQKRAGLARAMALDPEILFFDEPSAGLDPISSKLLDELILSLRDNLNATIVMVTHELASIFSIGDNSVFLDPESKTMIAEGDPNILLKSSKDDRVIDFLSRKKK